MSEKNRDHVAVYDDPLGNWMFVLPSEEIRCSEVTAQAIEIASSVFESFDEFLIPQRLSVRYLTFDGDRSLESLEQQWNPIDRIHRTVDGESRVSFEDFTELLHSSDEPVVYLREIEFDQSRIFVELDDWEGYVDRTSGCREYRGSTQKDVEPLYDPVQIRIHHTRNRDFDEIEEDYIFTVSIRVFSDIWLEESDIGSDNRNYLTDFIRRVDERIPNEVLNRSPEPNNLDHIY